MTLFSFQMVGIHAEDQALKHAKHIVKTNSSKIIILNVLVPWSNPFFEELPDDGDTHVIK